MINFLLVNLIAFFLLTYSSVAEDISNFLNDNTSIISLTLLGIFLGLTDGLLNPCALSVMFFLIAYLLALGSKNRILKVGLVYSATVFIVYFLFMYGVLSIISIIGYLPIIKKIISSIIIIFGAIQIKDFFWYGKGIKLGIPKSAKSLIKELVESATIPSTILLGFFVSLVEIPCAGAFPFAYITILAENTSDFINFFYLSLYNFFFVLPLIIMTLVFYFGFLKVEQAEKTRLKLRKYMRLTSGIILIALGIALILDIV